MKKRYLDCKYLDAGMDGMLCSMDLCTTCKEFNGENCSNYVSKTTMNNNNEIPKENQIYDIAKIIFERGVALDGIDFACGLVGSDHFDRIARAIYNAGYRNCKDKVVLSKEELNTLIGNIEKSSEIKAEELDKVRKETIKEIIDKIDDMIGGKMIAQALREIYEVEE